MVAKEKGNCFLLVQMQHCSSIKNGTYMYVCTKNVKIILLLQMISRYL